MKITLLKSSCPPFTSLMASRSLTTLEGCSGRSGSGHDPASWLPLPLPPPLVSVSNKILGKGKRKGHLRRWWGINSMCLCCSAVCRATMSLSDVPATRVTGLRVCAVPAGSAEAWAACSQGQVSGPCVAALLVKVVEFQLHVQEHPQLPKNFLSHNFGKTPGPTRTEAFWNPRF